MYLRLKHTPHLLLTNSLVHFKKYVLGVETHTFRSQQIWAQPATHPATQPPNSTPAQLQRQQPPNATSDVTSPNNRPAGTRNHTGSTLRVCIMSVPSGTRPATKCAMTETTGLSRSRREQRERERETGREREGDRGREEEEPTGDGEREKDRERAEEGERERCRAGQGKPHRGPPRCASDTCGPAPRAYGLTARMAAFGWWPGACTPGSMRAHPELSQGPADLQSDRSNH